MRRVNLDFPWRKVGFGTNHRKINDLVLTVDQEVGGSNPPSCTSKINKLGKRGRVCSKSFFGIRCFALESLWNSSKDFRTRCCKINELTLARNQAVRGSRPQPEPGTRTPPQRSRWAYRKRDEVSCSRRLTVRSQRLRICEVHPELRLRCDACPGAGYANGAEIPRLFWLPPIIRSV